MVRAPDGKIFGPKKEKIFGKDVGPDGTDSHFGGFKTNDEAIVAFLHDPGDYLIFYRIPREAAPAGYANLRGYLIYHELEYHGNNQGDALNKESGLIASKASGARPGAMYAWAIVTYDPAKRHVEVKAPEGKLPEGILPPPP